MKRFAIALAAVLATTAAQAEQMLAGYRGPINTSDTLNVWLYDTPVDHPMCRVLTAPREVRASLTWTAVTEATTPFASGCWSLEGSRIVLVMRAYGDGRQVELSLAPRDFIRNPYAPFYLWRTANSQTLEPFDYSEIDAKPLSPLLEALDQDMQRKFGY